MSGSKPSWSPSKERVAHANLTAFRLTAARRWGVDLPEYEALWRWSIERRADFWRSVCDDPEAAVRERLAANRPRLGMA